MVEKFTFSLRNSTTSERLPWPVAAFTAVTFMSATAVGVTATDTFTRLTMLGGVIACIAIWQVLRDPLVIASLMTMVFGAVLGWGLNFYDRIHWYDDFAHFTFSFVSVIALARIALPRFHSDSLFLLLFATWLAWLGIGSLWEIAEWGSDQLANTYHSRGYPDTMYDMILNSTGAALGLVVHWRWLHRPSPLAKQD